MLAGTSSADRDAAEWPIAPKQRVRSHWYDREVELQRFRHYDKREKAYSGWMGSRLTRAEFSRASGVPVPTLKSWETRNVKPRPATIAKIEALMVEIRASEQSELLDNRATRAAEKVAAKAAANKQRALDAMLDRAMRRCRPLSKKAKQRGLF